MTNFLLNADKLAKPLAWFAIVVCVITWGMDLTGMVEECPYCRAQRTMMGLAGIVMLLPWVNIITRYFVLLFGFFGSVVASMQIFDHYMNNDFSEAWIYYATCALLILLGQLIVTFTRNSR